MMFTAAQTDVFQAVSVLNVFSNTLVMKRLVVNSFAHTTQNSMCPVAFAAALIKSRRGLTKRFAILVEHESTEPCVKVNADDAPLTEPGADHVCEHAA